MKAASALALALLALAGTASAQELTPEPGRYRPLYPSLYYTFGLAQDPRDSSFDQDGNRRDSVAPHSGDSAFPQRYAVSAFAWHFPMFESQDVPFFSSRMHMARVTLRYVDTRTEGQLAAFAADTSDDAQTNADGLKNNGKGVGDLSFEFGSFLAGAPSSGWRSGTHDAASLLLLLGIDAPTGVYEHESPNNAGSNRWSFSGKLAAHWGMPWRGFFDGALGYRAHSIDYEPAFGHEAPFRAGADRLLDASYTQRVVPGLYLEAFVTDRQGRANQYRNLEYTPNAPAAPAPSQGNYTSRDFPTPGEYNDHGTALRTVGLSAQFFIAQRWRASFAWSHPQSGRSGEFDQPFTNRQCRPSGGTSSALCTDAPDGSRTVDGLGSARSYASDTLTVYLTHQFGLGDVFSCPGCEP